jgi:hypothetical protein
VLANDSIIALETHEMFGREVRAAIAKIGVAMPKNIPPFESLKKLNEHGVEYWSARDLQPCLGYSEWRKFENTIKKAITSCKQSSNDPNKHFVGADKMISK